MNRLITICFLSFLTLTAHAFEYSCPTSYESRRLIKEYLVIDVQGSKEIAEYLLMEIAKIKSSPTNKITEISGNAYVLTLSKELVTIELSANLTKDEDQEVLISKHLLCDFENQLLFYYKKLK